MRQGHDVYCIDNLSSGHEANISHLRSFGNFAFHCADVRLPIHVTRKCDVVFNLASRASRGEWEAFPTDILTTCAVGSLNLLEYSKNSNAKYVYMSSSEVYGDPEIVPTPENYEGRVSPIGSRSSYDEGKRFGESLAMAYHREHKVDVSIVRLFNTYGPRIRGDGEYGRVIPRFLQQALTNSPLTIYGDGSQTRSFVYVSDVIDVLTKILHADCSGEVFNVGNPSEISILQLAETIVRLTRSESAITHAPLPTDDPKRRCPDVRCVARRLNWVPSVTLEQGLLQLIAWYTCDVTKTSRDL